VSALLAVSALGALAFRLTRLWRASARASRRSRACSALGSGLATVGAVGPDRTGGVRSVLVRLRESLLSVGLSPGGASLYRRAKNPNQWVGRAFRVGLRLGGGRLNALLRLKDLLAVFRAVGVALAIDFVADQLRLGAAERGPKGNGEGS